MKQNRTAAWWGPPKKFSSTTEDRKISWLELFYDLVYVIAIARITRHLSEHLDVYGFLDYIYLFVMLFWGWLNGSLHHDIHGSRGLRTNLMTLWQIMIVAALIVTLNSPQESLVYNATIALMVMQVYITYIWWSVGIYDKDHRVLNRPYTICYLSSLGLLFLTLFSDQQYIRILFYLSLAFNYLPPFWVNFSLGKRESELSLSASMSERLGLFTIILFGELVSGVIYGVSELHNLNLKIWINFGLAILLVFALWWIFFAMVADRISTKGFLISTLITILYIPTLMSLGMIAVGFNALFSSFEANTIAAFWIKTAFGCSISCFLLGIVALTQFFDYSPAYQSAKQRLQILLIAASLTLLVVTAMNLNFSLSTYLLIIVLILIGVIVAISRSWLKLANRKEQ